VLDFALPLPAAKLGDASEMQEKSIFLAISLGLHYLCSYERFLAIVEAICAAL
jgi:hypothetical protein